MKTSLGLFVILAGFSLLAQAQNCVQLDCNDGYCSFQPNRFKAKFPDGFELKSVAMGHHMKITPPGGNPAATHDCTVVKRLPGITRLDDAELHGWMEIAGKLHATGTLSFEPREGGYLIFSLDEKSLNGSGPFFKSHFGAINLDQAQPPVKVKPPAKLAGTECWKAKASIELSGFTVAIVDSCEGGTSARHARITAISEFSGCEAAYKK